MLNTFNYRPVVSGRYFLKQMSSRIQDENVDVVVILVQKM